MTRVRLFLTIAARVTALRCTIGPVGLQVEGQETGEPRHLIVVRMEEILCPNPSFHVLMYIDTHRYRYIEV